MKFMELEQRIKLVKTAPQKDSAPQTPPKSINIPPKKKLINENSAIIKRFQQAEQKANREKLSDDELIERDFEKDPEVMALRAKNNSASSNHAPLQTADIDDYIQQSQIPQTRNITNMELASMGLASEAEFIANEAIEAIDKSIFRSPLPSHSTNIDKKIEKPKRELQREPQKEAIDRIDLSDLLPTSQRYKQYDNMPRKMGALGLIETREEDFVSQDSLDSQNVGKFMQDLAESNVDSHQMDLQDSHSAENNTPHIIYDIARANNSDAIVGIYTPDPRDLDSEPHHRVEIVDKIDSYDIEFPKSKTFYDNMLDNSVIDSTDDIDVLNEINNSLSRAQKRLEERLKIAKMRQKLGDIKSITPIDSGNSNDSAEDLAEDSQIFMDFSQHKNLDSQNTPQDSRDTQNFKDFKVDLSDLRSDSDNSKDLQNTTNTTNHAQNPQDSQFSKSSANNTNPYIYTRNEALARQNAESIVNDDNSNNDEFNENFFDLEPSNLTPPQNIINQSTANQSANPNAIHATNPNLGTNPNANQSTTQSNDGTFHLPPLNLLNPPLSQKIDIDDSEIDIKVQNLFNKLRVFKIEGDIVRTYSGPVVTTFEFRPAPNVKVSRIQNLQDDLSMALKATSIRIQAPIPGKDVVGIEIPNNKIQTIFLREIFESEEFRNSSANLPIALGKDVIGNPVIEDLAKLPHLLIAGTTGSGKSVGINAMILSLLYKHTPKDLRFIMIDPKIIEFGLYKDIPHLLTPIITDPKKAIIALSKAVEEMNRRYELMDKAKVKTIVSYNELAEANGGDNQMDKLPYIVIIIDEFADLMIMGGREAEQFLISLAGKARASGIHLIIATQRPTVNVVTGLIKGNLPSKISYRVGSKIDSKVILDETGAEALLGRGDMLFSKTNNIVRLHAPYNDGCEIERVVEFLKSQQEVEYDEFFSLEQKEPVGTPQPTQISSEGDYIERAKEIINQSGKTSISYLQRGLGVGFNKAASIVELLEKNGFLSPPNSKGVREIIGN